MFFSEGKKGFYLTEVGFQRENIKSFLTSIETQHTHTHTNTEAAEAACHGLENQQGLKQMVLRHCMRQTLGLAVGRLTKRSNKLRIAIKPTSTPQVRCRLFLEARYH
jgi:hypothetical protein